jgi:CheY-like chemotaxis protein
MKILIADDELITRAFLKRMLEKLGHEVIECEDGGQAWQHISSDNPPLLCILDWMMPKHSGPELCYSARNLPRGNSFYLILLTSKSNKTDIVEGLSSGANDYIVKPFNKDELKARIDVGIRTLELRGELEKEHDQLLQLSKFAAMTALAFSNQSSEKSIMHKLSIPGMVKQGVDYCQNSIFKSELLNIKVTSHVTDAFVDCKGNTLPQVILTMILNSLEALQRHPTHNLEIQISEQGEKIEVSFKEPMIRSFIAKKFDSPLLGTDGASSPVALSKIIIEKHGGEFIEVQDKNSTHYVLRLPKAA